MKFLLKFVMCCGSCASIDRIPADEKRLLVVQETLRRGGGGRRKGRSRGGSGEWRPSLTSILEETGLMTEKVSSGVVVSSQWMCGGGRLKRKVSSRSQRDRSRSSDCDYHR